MMMMMMIMNENPGLVKIAGFYISSKAARFNVQMWVDSPDVSSHLGGVCLLHLSMLWL